RPAEPGDGDFAHDEPQHRRMEHTLVDDAPAVFRAVVLLDAIAGGADADDDERPERHDAVAHRDDDTGGQREFRAQAGEQRRERRDDLPENDADHEYGDGDDRHRVNHRGLDLALQLDGLFDVGGQPL